MTSPFTTHAASYISHQNTKRRAPLQPVGYTAILFTIAPIYYKPSVVGLVLAWLKMVDFRGEKRGDKRNTNGNYFHAYR